MALYAYKARNASGQIVTGQLESNSEQTLKGMLFRQGFIPISVKKATSFSFDLESIKDMLTSVRPQEIIMFTRQFYTLYKAGVGIDTILGTLDKQIQNPRLAKAIRAIRQDVAQGTSITKAFTKQNRVFDELYIAMLSAGEEAGVLEDVLKELYTIMEKEAELKSKMSSALMYPKIVVVGLGLAFWVLMTFVVPKFTDLFAGRGVQLPVPTRVLLFCSFLFTNYWWALILGLGGLIGGYRYLYSKPWGRLFFDKKKFKYPIFGMLNTKVVNARYGHVLSALYKSGLSMLRALEIIASVIQNRAFQLDMRNIIRSVSEGQSLANSMRRGHYFTSIMIETTAIGEQSGALDEMMEAIAAHYDMEVDEVTKNLSALIEPILLLVVGVMVAFLALGIFLPIWQLSKVMT